jgi:hypothetical protein
VKRVRRDKFGIVGGAAVPLCLCEPEFCLGNDWWDRTANARPYSVVIRLLGREISLIGGKNTLFRHVTNLSPNPLI